MNAVAKFMEYFWLAAFVGSLMYVLYFLINNGIDNEGLTLLLFPALAGLMFFARRFVRRKFEKNQIK